MLSLNSTKEIRDSEKDYIEYLDNQIINALVFEQYFKDILNTKLLEIITPYLIDINCIKHEDEKLVSLQTTMTKMQSNSSIKNEIKGIQSRFPLSS